MPLGSLEESVLKISTIKKCLSDFHPPTGCAVSDFETAVLDRLPQRQGLGPGRVYSTLSW